MDTRNERSAAAEAYRVRRAEISRRIARIELALADHGRRPKSWPGVGDLGHIAELLGEIEEFLGIPEPEGAHP